MTDPAGETRGRLARSPWTRPAVIGTAILVASLLPLPRDDAVPPVVPFGIDTWIHAISYAVFAASLLGATRAEEPRGSGLRGILIVATVAVALGTGVEVVQTVIPGRTFEVADVVANAVGVLLGLVVADWY